MLTSCNKRVKLTTWNKSVAIFAITLVSINLFSSTLQQVVHSLLGSCVETVNRTLLTKLLLRLDIGGSDELQNLIAGLPQCLIQDYLCR